MDAKKALKDSFLPVAIVAGMVGVGLAINQPVHAAPHDLGTDVSKFQPQLTNNSGDDKFSFAQVGGSIHGWIITKRHIRIKFIKVKYGLNAQLYLVRNWSRSSANKVALDIFK